jgi:hypothetical protein
MALGRHEIGIFHMKRYKSWVHFISSFKNVAITDSFHESLINLKKTMAGSYRVNNLHYSVFSQAEFSF